MNEKRFAEKLARKYETRDPLRIASELGYIIIYTPLTGIRGFYQHLKRCNIIYLDSGMDERTTRFVCAHELGHSLMHRGLNRIFMETHTFMVASRYENEANRFAVSLIYSDEDLQPFLSCGVDCAAHYMGVSYVLAEYRMSHVVPDAYVEDWL